MAVKSISIPASPFAAELDAIRSALTDEALTSEGRVLRICGSRNFPSTHRTRRHIARRAEAIRGVCSRAACKHCGSINLSERSAGTL